MNLPSLGQFSQKQIIVLGIVVVIVVAFILGLFGIIPGFKKQTTSDPNFPTGAVTLQIWGVGDEYQTFSDIVKSYQAIYSNVKVNYTKFSDPVSYEQQLVNALAENRGPDIFMVKNNWVYQHWGKMFPAGSFTSGPAITSQQMAALFPPVVSSDFVLNGNVFALPLSMDTLSLIYNKDVFAAKGIVYPPASWDDFVNDVTKIREVDQSKKITLSAAAMGTARNIGNVSDILSVLALQSGSSINNPNGAGVLFDDPFSKAVQFYIQFANPISPYYTWNESFDNSVSSFAAGTTAMILDYHSAFADIKNRNPYLNFGVAALPQVSQNASRVANYASYWGFAVSKQSKNPYVSWSFIKYMTTNPQAISIYLQNTNCLPALLAMIQAEIGGDNNVFAREALTAKSWQQADANAIDASLRNMIGDILSGKVDTQSAIKASEEEINKLY